MSADLESTLLSELEADLDKKKTVEAGGETYPVRETAKSKLKQLSVGWGGGGAFSASLQVVEWFGGIKPGSFATFRMTMVIGDGDCESEAELAPAAHPIAEYTSECGRRKSRFLATLGMTKRGWLLADGAQYIAPLHGLAG
jgi:hypothetical protein